MLNISPSWLVVFGLGLNFVGALLISIEAVGATEFVKALKSERKIEKRLANTSFISTINTTFIFILVWIITFSLLLAFVSKLSVVEDLLIAPLGFFLWKLSIKFTKFIEYLVKFVAPPRSFCEKGFVCLLISLVWGLLWAILFLFVSLIVILVRYGIDLPLRFFSEKVIGFLVMLILKKVDETVRDMKHWYFKGPVFVGVVFLLGGFLYQIIGTILLILENVDR